MKKFVLASNNRHKIEEFKAMLDGVEILSLKDIGFFEDIDECGETLQENAKIKVDSVKKFLETKGVNFPIISDDSGLFVNALGGAPGVHSARYAFDHNDEGNRQALLKNMLGIVDRSAYFECCICFEDEFETRFFTGRTMGHITTEKIGDESFCFDCLFYSDDLKKTFGQATEQEKDSVSHRGRAVKNLKEYLKSKNYL